MVRAYWKKDGVKLDLDSKIVLVFMGAGSLAGIASALLANGWLALLVVLGLFYLVYRLAPQYLKIDLKTFSRMDVLKTGFWPHFIMWLIVWVVVYSVMFIH